MTELVSLLLNARSIAADQRVHGGKTGPALAALIDTLVHEIEKLRPASVPPEEPRLDLEPLKARCDTLRRFPDHEDIDETLKMAETLIAEVERLRALHAPEAAKPQRYERDVEEVAGATVMNPCDSGAWVRWRDIEHLFAAALPEVRPSQEADRARLRYLIIEATQIARVSGTFNESVFAFGLDAILDELAVVAPSLRAPQQEK